MKRNGLTACADFRLTDEKIHVLLVGECELLDCVDSLLPVSIAHALFPSLSIFFDLEIANQSSQTHARLVRL